MEQKWALVTLLVQLYRCDYCPRSQSNHDLIQIVEVYNIGRIAKRMCYFVMHIHLTSHDQVEPE